MNDKLIGRQLDEYRIEAVLGAGGMARVYRATDTRLQRQVAIKVINTPHQNEAEYVERFEREALAVARFEHPHIVSVYRYGLVDGVMYLALQLVSGTDLRTLLNTYRQSYDFIDMQDALEIVRQVCTALDYAHARGVIHRDVKPSNILLDEQGNAYLADFGLARLVDVATKGRIFGSVHYMAPEQAISSAAAVPQTDLYAVGVLLYEMLAGQPPFNAENPTDIALKHMDEAPPPLRQHRPEISAPIEAVVLRALAKKPEQRYKTGRDLYQALAEAVEGKPHGVAESTTLVSRESLAQRIREAAAGDLPPIPAAALDTTGSEIIPAPVLPPGRISGQRRTRSRLWTHLIAGSALTVILLAAALFGPLNSLLDHPDRDGDTVANADDNCPDLANPDQADTDGDGTGDACQDSDRDRVPDIQDKCPQRSGLPAEAGCPIWGTVTLVGMDRANLREGPGEGYAVVNVVRHSSRIEVSGRDASRQWLRVYDPISERYAWISRDLVALNTEYNQLPVVE